MAEPGTLTVTPAVTGGVTVLHVKGEVDVATLDIFTSALRAAAVAGPVVVSLDECGWLDSSARGALVNARRLAAGRGHAVALACTRERLLKILRYQGLHQVFAVCETDEAALEAVRQP